MIALWLHNSSYDTDYTSGESVFKCVCVCEYEATIKSLVVSFPRREEMLGFGKKERKNK